MTSAGIDTSEPAGRAPSHAVDRDALRREMRTRRRSLSNKQRQDAAQALTRILARRNILRAGARIAMYLACRGEMDLSPLIELARRRGCEIYLPLVTSTTRGRMEFVRFETGQSLQRNRFGIEEPDPRTSPRIDTRRLDVVLLPLVAVDARGWRLGSGAGFYDRRLRHLRTDRRWRRPRLIGIAYDFQRVARLEPQPWDIPVDAIATERAFHIVHRPFQSLRHEQSP